jgi:predicted dehydrogenase
MPPLDRRSFLVHSAGAAAAIAIVPDLSRAATFLGAEPLNVAVVGAGRQGRTILGELVKIDAAKVVAVCDSNESRMQGGVRRVEGAEGFTDHKQMLDKKKELHAIIVATPTHLHKDVVIDCLAAGKHVYCEAPLAHTIDDARAIAAAAAAHTKSVFACGFEGRSNPVYKLARTFYKSDAAREFISADIYQHQKISWRYGGNDLNSPENWRLNPKTSTGLAGEWGSHQLDVVRWYTGRTPVSIRGHGSVRLYKDGRDVPDTVRASLLFDDGADMGYEATLANSFGGRYELLYAEMSAFKLAWSHGWMFKEADAPTQGWEVYANRQQFFSDEGITLIADATKLASQGKLKEGVGLPFPSVYYALADFVAASLEGKPAACGADDGFAATALAILTNKAVTTGEEVKVSEADIKV